LQDGCIYSEHISNEPFSANVFDISNLASSGEYNLTTCLLVPAISEYNVTLQDGVVTLKDDYNQRRVVSIANNTRSISTNPAAVRAWQQPTLDFLTEFTNLVVDSNASVGLDQYSGLCRGDLALPRVNLRWSLAREWYFAVEWRSTSQEDRQPIMMFGSDLLASSSVVLSEKLRRGLDGFQYCA
jgi:hypothetical protein